MVKHSSGVDLNYALALPLNRHTRTAYQLFHWGLNDLPYTHAYAFMHTHARAITTLRNDVSAKCESDPRGLPMLLLLLGMPVSALVRGPIANGPHICWRFAVFLSACVSVCVCFYCLALATQTQANRNRCGQLARGTSGGWSGGLTYKFELVEPIEFD